MTRHVRDDEAELAAAIRAGARKRHEQLFGAYFEGRDRSDAFGSAYEGIYRLPADATGIRPKGIYKFFSCLDDSVRRCPEAGCKKQLLLDSLLIHLNDDHRWSRERIAAWVEGEVGPDATPPAPQPK
ncbi:MAG TPA: hypothetical protein VGK32_19380 [Vicinamibacterales bacterium]|jgi:hypothetical protein